MWSSSITLRPTISHIAAATAAEAEAEAEAAVEGGGGSTFPGEEKMAGINRRGGSGKRSNL